MAMKGPKGKIPKVGDTCLLTLIELVKGHPLLYDHRHPDHKDGVKIDAAWASIQARLRTYSPTMNAEHWKVKWRTQRDTYIRKRKKMKEMRERDAATMMARWKFGAPLAFLNAFTEDVNMDATVKLEEMSDDDLSRSELAPMSQNEDVLDGMNQFVYPIVCQPTEHIEPPIHITPAFTESTEDPDKPLYSSFTQRANSETAVVGLPEDTFTPPNSTYHQRQPNPRTRENKRKRLSAIEAEANVLRQLQDEISPSEDDDLRSEEGKVDNQVERNSVDLFFEFCSMRVKCLPPGMRSVVQMQIQQVLFNAENPGLPQQQIMSLPQSLIISPAPSVD